MSPRHESDFRLVQRILESSDRSNYARKNEPVRRTRPEAACGEWDVEHVRETWSNLYVCMRGRPMHCFPRRRSHSFLPLH